MSFVFSKVVDFLLQSKYGSIALLIVGILLGWTASNLFHQRQVKILEALKNLKDQEVKNLQDEIEKLNDTDRIDAKEISKIMENHQPALAVNLNSLEISAIIKIYEFETKNSPKASQEYSFEDLMTDLNISYFEANAVIDKFRRFGLFSSPWDSVLQFPNLDRPINESKPGRLTQEGIDIAIRYQGTNQHK